MEESVELEFEVDAIAGVLVVVAHGELVHSALAKLRECFDRAVTGGRPVVLDLLAVTAVDDAGVRLLLDAHGSLGRRLRIVAERDAPPHVGLKEAGIAHVLALERSRVSALAASAPLATS
jgi:anti-anti-sigma regulatory factor